MATTERRNELFYQRIYKDLSKERLYQWLSSSNDVNRGILRRLDFAYAIPQEKDDTILDVDENRNGLLSIIHNYSKKRPTSEMLELYSTVLDKCQKLKKIVKDFLEAKYDDFNKEVDGLLVELLKNDPHSPDNTTFCDIGTNFYKIRKFDEVQDDKTLIEPLDLFHIPFTKRELTGYYRYSIPGYPSLYAASSLFCAWEEMGRPDYLKSCGILFSAKDKIKLLDLRFRFSLQNPKEIKQYILRLPLIIACSMHVKEKSEKFVPEYIISQQVFKWLMSILNKELFTKINFGVTYTSAKKSVWESLLNNQLEEKEITNYALLASMGKNDYVYSTQLASRLKVKDPMMFPSYPLAQESAYAKISKFEEQLNSQKVSHRMSTFTDKANKKHIRHNP